MNFLIFLVIALTVLFFSRHRLAKTLGRTNPSLFEPAFAPTMPDFPELRAPELGRYRREESARLNSEHGAAISECVNAIAQFQEKMGTVAMGMATNSDMSAYKIELECKLGLDKLVAVLQTRHGRAIVKEAVCQSDFCR